MQVEFTIREQSPMTEAEGERLGQTLAREVAGERKE